jgi:hypothetical protein
MNKAKKTSTTDGKLFLAEAFSSERYVLHTKLQFSSSTVTHDGKMGEVNEAHFVELLKRYMPARYSVESGIIIDSKGATSDQIDVVIYDRQYTPVLLDQKEHRYIPAEAVYAIFEVKPTCNKPYLEYAAVKAESVRKLVRTSATIMYSDGPHPAKKPFEIIAGIVSTEVAWSGGFGPTFKLIHSKLNRNKFINCGLAASGACFDTFDANKKLQVRKGDDAVGFFLFRLLHALQTLGTVPAVDWNAYAAVFGK